MSATDDLRSAGFSDDEVNGFAAEKRQQLLGAGFNDEEVNGYLGAPPLPQPNMATANRSFGRVMMDGFAGLAHVIGDDAKALMPSSSGFDVDLPGSATAHVGKAPSANTAVEATANTIVGLGAFPAALVGAPLSIVQQWLSGGPAKDETFEQAMSRIQQGIAGPLYEESSPQGKELTDQIGALFNSVLIPMGAHLAAHPQMPEQAAAAYRALPSTLRDEMARKVSGQPITGDDMANVAKVIPGAKPEQAPVIERSLRSVYDETGIGPYTVLQDAHTDPSIAHDLANPEVEIPNAYRQYTDEFSGPIDETPEPLPQMQDRSAVDEQLSIVDQNAEAEAAAQKAQEEQATKQQAIDEGEAPPEKAAPDIVEVRKRQSVLNSLLDCLS